MRARSTVDRTHSRPDRRRSRLPPCVSPRVKLRARSVDRAPGVVAIMIEL